MTRIAISSGHGKHIRGARGSPVPPQVDERDENVRVVDQVYSDLQRAGVTVAKFHDDVSTSQNENLNRIVNWHNAQSRDLDVSVHFNAYDHSAHGTEVLYVSQSSLAKKVCDAIVAAGGFTNRGPKYNGGLAFLNGTNKPAILIETCFCDNTNDCNAYNAKFAAICEAIAESISNVQVPDEEGPPPPEVTDPDPGPGPELVVHVTIEAPAGVIVAVDVRETTTGRKVEIERIVSAGSLANNRRPTPNYPTVVRPARPAPVVRRFSISNGQPQMDCERCQKMRDAILARMRAAGIMRRLKARRTAAYGNGQGGMARTPSGSARGYGSQESGPRLSLVGKPQADT